MCFIWVLNDIENEMIFMGTRKIKTNVGQLFIFPSYWSFPYRDTNVTDIKYYIKGHIEIENKYGIDNSGLSNKDSSI